MHICAKIEEFDPNRCNFSYIFGNLGFHRWLSNAFFGEIYCFCVCAWPQVLMFLRVCVHGRRHLFVFLRVEAIAI